MQVLVLAITLEVTEFRYCASRGIVLAVFPTSSGTRCFIWTIDVKIDDILLEVADNHE